MKNASTELSREDTTAVRQVVLPIVITHLHGHMEAVGTCWIFCTAGREALAFSASHIFDYVARLEGRHDNYAASMPDILRPEKPPSVELQFTRLQAFYQATDDMGYAAHIVAAHRDGAHDLCVCHLMLGDDVPADVRFSRCIELATALPSVGTNVQVCGYSSLGDTSYTADPTTGVIAGRLNPMVEFRGGEVVYAHPLGRPMGPPGPGFEVNVSALHGMSGGPIIDRGYGHAVVACGVVSRSNAFTDEGRTVAAALWPSYAMKIDRLKGELGNQLWLADLARRGAVVDHSDGPAHFRWVSGNAESGGDIIWVD